MRQHARLSCSLVRGGSRGTNEADALHTTTPARDVIPRAAAGALATLAMGKVTGYLYQHEPPPVRERYEQVTGAKSPPERAAERFERALGLALSDPQREKLAEASTEGLMRANRGGGWSVAVDHRR